MQSCACTPESIPAPPTEPAVHPSSCIALLLYFTLLTIPLPMVTETLPLPFSFNYMELNVLVFWTCVPFKLNRVCAHAN